jgi:outer membrane protein assembly factor BamE (lipoprotein component of BamABCDE complex)
VIIAHDGDSSSDWRAEQKQNRLAISQLRLDMSRSEVEAKVGTPEFTEAFSSEGQDYYVVYYRTHKDESDGKTTKSETTPIVFSQDQVVGWGQSAVDKARNL